MASKKGDGLIQPAGKMVPEPVKVDIQIRLFPFVQ